MKEDRSTSPAADAVRHLAAVSASSAHGAATAHAPRGPSGDRPGQDRRPHRMRALSGGQDGFTLVELLVVVLMLVALVGIAVPTFVGQRDGAIRAAVQSELRTAAIALETFRAQQGVYDEEALTAAFGYVPSLEVASFLTLASGGSSFCVLAWYDPDLDPSAVTSQLAAAEAEWAISPSGMEFVGDQGSSRTCSS
jgi:prepilin-type N-terminal cleavage/methylation domain-containing protein